MLGTFWLVVQTSSKALTDGHGAYVVGAWHDTSSADVECLLNVYERTIGIL